MIVENSYNKKKSGEELNEESKNSNQNIQRIWIKSHIEKNKFYQF